ncbi:MAG: hypothetical protein GXP48_00435 [Acidobacteria bacterium]|nr:hypothetical protein [Acidobacteriota bacterium]
MSKLRALGLVVIVTGLLLCAGMARADVVWSWQFQNEKGTFTTDGTVADLAGPHTFTILSFQVTASDYPANVGATYTWNQPPQGLIWDGSAITQFFRSGGTLTNGSNFFNADTYWAYTLVPDTGLLSDDSEETVTSGALTVAPILEPEAIPTLGGPGLVTMILVVGLLGIAAIRRTQRLA